MLEISMMEIIKEKDLFFNSIPPLWFSHSEYIKCSECPQSFNSSVHSMDQIILNPEPFSSSNSISWSQIHSVESLRKHSGALPDLPTFQLNCEQLNIKRIIDPQQPSQDTGS